MSHPLTQLCPPIRPSLLFSSLGGVGGGGEVSFTYICHAEEALLSKQTPPPSQYMTEVVGVVEQILELLGTRVAEFKEAKTLLCSPGLALR